MNEFNTAGMSEVSAHEMEQIDGGVIWFVVGALVGGAIGFGSRNDNGGGEVLPGFNGFLAATKGIATAAGGRP